jgi:20S proteasome alpha/beta subunit
MGKNYVNGKTFLEKRYNVDLELEDAIHTAILTLKVTPLTCSFSTLPSQKCFKKHSRICDTVF